MWDHLTILWRPATNITSGHLLNLNKLRQKCGCLTTKPLNVLFWIFVTNSESPLGSGHILSYIRRYLLITNIVYALKHRTRPCIFRKLSITSGISSIHLVYTIHIEPGYGVPLRCQHYQPCNITQTWIIISSLTKAKTTRYLSRSYFWSFLDAIRWSWGLPRL